MKVIVIMYNIHLDNLARLSHRIVLIIKTINIVRKVLFFINLFLFRAVLQLVRDFSDDSEFVVKLGPEVAK